MKRSGAGRRTAQRTSIHWVLKAQPSSAHVPSSAAAFCWKRFQSRVNAQASAPTHPELVMTTLCTSTPVAITRPPPPPPAASKAEPLAAPGPTTTSPEP
jgi:hypothetical protein